MVTSLAPVSDVDVDVDLARPWRTIVWDDPVNLIQYVVHVLESHFGYSRERATELTMQIHNEGKSCVASGAREETERHVNAMHSYGLWATMERDD